jgi:hypothetical protein
VEDKQERFRRREEAFRQAVQTPDPVLPPPNVEAPPPLPDRRQRRRVTPYELPELVDEPPWHFEGPLSFVPERMPPFDALPSEKRENLARRHRMLATSYEGPLPWPDLTKAQLQVHYDGARKDYVAGLVIDWTPLASFRRHLYGPKTARNQNQKLKRIRDLFGIPNR